MQREGAVGGIEQVVPLVEDDAHHALPLGPASHRVDHHQRVIGNDEVGIGRGAAGALDEAAAVVRAAGVDAFAAPIGQRTERGALEQCGEPARKVAADHVAVAGVGGPASRELREHRRAAHEAALQRVLEVQQADVVLAALADDGAALLDRGVGVELGGLGIQLPLQRFGVGRQPHRRVGALGP